MKKWIVATLMTVAMFGATAGGRSAPAAADPSAAAPDSYGGCRWTCSTTGAVYTSASRCTAACSGFCDAVC